MIRVYSSDEKVHGYAFLNVKTDWTIESYWADNSGNQIDESFFGTTIRLYYRLRGNIKSLYLDFSVGGINQWDIGLNLLGTQIEKGATEEEYQYIEVEIDDRWEFTVPMRYYHEMNLSVGYSILRYSNKEHLNSIRIVQFHYESGLITGGPNYTGLPTGFSMLSRGNLEQDVHALVLHRTSGSTLTSALNTMSDSAAAHLYVDKDGSICQGVSLRCNASHVGKIRPRSEYRTKVTKNKHDIEIQKEYPDRYPYNSDSIGIEVVGTVIREPVWTNLTEAQTLSTARLTNFIISQFNLVSSVDIYAHEEISSKTEGEGTTILNAIRQYII